MGYSVKVLSNEDFEKLPYEYISQAFAVTSPDKKDIFVRHSNIHDFNKMLISHELDHLVEEVPTDEGPQGERYLLGDLLSGLWGGIKNIGSGLLGGLGNLFGGGGGGGSQGGNFLPFSQLLSQNAKNNYTGPVNYGGGFGQSFKGGFGSSLGQGLGQGLMSLFGNKLGSSTGSIFNSITNPSTLLGGGLLGLGLGKKLPNAPPLPPSVEQYRQQSQAGGSPLGQQAQGVISQNLSKQFQPLSQPEIDAALKQLDEEQMWKEEYTRNIYRGLGRSPDPIEDRQFNNDISAVQAEYGQRKADTLTNLTRQSENYFNQNQQANIQQAIGASNDQMRQLSEIAQLDVYQIAQQLQIDLAQAQQFKETFTNLGSQLVSSGLGVPTMNLFGL